MPAARLPAREWVEESKKEMSQGLDEPEKRRAREKGKYGTAGMIGMEAGNALIEAMGAFPFTKVARGASSVIGSLSGDAGNVARVKLANPAEYLARVREGSSQGAEEFRNLYKGTGMRQRPRSEVMEDAIRARRAAGIKGATGEKVSPQSDLEGSGVAKPKKSKLRLADEPSTVAKPQSKVLTEMEEFYKLLHGGGE